MYLTLFSLGVLLLISGGILKFVVERDFLSDVGRRLDYISFQEEMKKSKFNSKHKTAKSLVALGPLAALVGAFNL